MQTPSPFTAAFLVPLIVVLMGLQLYLGVAEASAVGTTVNVKVDDGTPAQFVVPPTLNRSVVKSRYVMFSGAIHNVSQIMVYIDSVYSQTIPIDSSDTTYDFTVELPPGTHEVKLNAIDVIDGTIIEKVVTITYTPSAESPGETITQTIHNTKQAVADSSDYLQAQIDQASSGSGPAAQLSDAAFNVMKALDLVPTSGGDSVERMAVRFWSITAGSSLMLFAHPLITGYHFLRYRLMKWNIHALPEVLRHHAALALRLLGGLLAIGTFFI